MKAQELRLGNFVQIAYTKEQTYIYKIEHRYKNVYEVNDLKFDGMTSSFEPIPITSKWLLKFGFEKNGERYYFPFGDVEKRFLRKEDYNNRWKELEKGWLCIGSWEGFNDTPLNYIHQLQNLFFALTGKELELKK